MNNCIPDIDDNPASMGLTVYLPNAVGNQAMTAHDGLSSLADARRERPDPIICNVQPPGLNGYGVIAILKSEGTLASILAIAVTALAMAEDLQKPPAARFDGYVSKPVEPERLVDAIEQFLKSSHAGSPQPARAPNIPQ
ncbi:response regulator [Noviherbaspirillum aerium]|uniref:response regulator n=1 Tax=Noviherbaspirillum aerium TaxID=2588497 RepID=UPI00124E0EB7|nr:response regulator [Noviherbaspirillum aerium]